MGKKYTSRRQFFSTILNPSGPEEDVAVQQGSPIKELPAGPDKLFERYSRKELGRMYSPGFNPEENGESQTANRVTTVSSGLTAYSGTWSEWEVAHLLRRTGFGVRSGDLSSLLAMTTGNAVDAVLTVTSTPSSPSTTPLNHYNNTIADSSSVALGASWTGTNLSYTGTANNDGTIDAYRQYSLQAWNWGLWLNGDYTIREKMVNFWHHFISVDFSDVRNTANNGATMCADYMTLLRNNATGNFVTLIKAIAKSPAMLVFLGGHYSTATVPNENFARELMELFTLGKVPTQNYDEFDIKAAAKVFSGWRVNSFTGSYPFTVAFNSTYHNTSNKVFSSNFSTTTITGLTGSSGSTEFDTFFNMLFAQQGTTIAQYVCRRLYRFFVYYDIDSTIETNVISGLATTLVNNSWNILPVLKQLFKSQHFYDMANRGVMIKPPFDLLAGTLRTFNVATTAATGTNQVVNQYAIWKYFNDYCNNYLEQSAGLVPNVSGYKAYYQTPGYYQSWINSNTIQRRASLINLLISGISTGGISVKIDSIAFVNGRYSQTVIQDPDLLVDAIVMTLLPIDLSTTVKGQLKTQNLLQNQTTNSYWTTAWTNYYGSPTNAGYISTVKTRLNNLLTAIMQMAEYQLM